MNVKYPCFVRVSAIKKNKRIDKKTRRIAIEKKPRTLSVNK